MRNDRYRHSVWIDVFGVVFLGAVVVGSAAYLLSELGQGALRSSVASRSVSPAAGPGSMTARHGRAGTGTSAYTPPRSTPSRSGLASTRSSRRAPLPEAPFSASWREQATPQLSTPSTLFGARSGGESQGGGARPFAGPEPGPTLANGASASRSSNGAGWRAEARRLTNRTQVLSNELAQRSTGRQRGLEASSSREPQRRQQGAESQTAARNVPEPPGVPIDDHLHWLVVAGVLWGIWRIWQGGS